VIRKAEPRVFEDFEHTASSVWGLIVPTGMAKFVYFMNAFGGGDLDRDLVGKIAINLPLRELTFASDHRRPKSKIKPGKWTIDTATAATRDPPYQRDTAGLRTAMVFGCQSPECQPPNGRPRKGLDGGKSLVSAAENVFIEAISTTYS
jgi:hypothetical protein